MHDGQSMLVPLLCHTSIFGPPICSVPVLDTTLASCLLPYSFTTNSAMSPFSILLSLSLVSYSVTVQSVPNLFLVRSSPAAWGLTTRTHPVTIQSDMSLWFATVWCLCLSWSNLISPSSPVSSTRGYWAHAVCPLSLVCASHPWSCGLRQGGLIVWRVLVSVCHHWESCIDRLAKPTQSACLSSFILRSQAVLETLVPNWQHWE